MRLLCLHGMGTNRNILELQLAKLQERLGYEHDFVYLQGHRECRAAVGVEQFFSGPFYCYYDVPTPDNVQNAIELIESTIEEEGPFDGIVGFSQGAALACAYVKQMAGKANKMHGLKFAVFLCASMPFDVTRTVNVRVEQTTLIDTSPQNEIDSADVLKLETEMKALGLLHVIQELEGKELTVLRRFAQKHGEKPLLDIPTLHLLGKQDTQYYTHGQRLAGLCDAKQTWIIEHRLGHEVPRNAVVVNRMATALEGMVKATSAA